MNNKHSIKPLISIIIPIYNTSLYIKELLQTIFNQNTNNIEIIIINDGTPDNSMEIVEQFVLTHENLIIINQVNKGLSEARNTGLRNATGQYIWFIDSDDNIQKDCLSELKELLTLHNSIEIFAFNILKIDESTNKETLDKLCYKTRHEKLYNKILSRNKTVNVLKEAFVQRFIFNRNFLQKNNLNFYPNIYHEDNEFMPRALFYTKKIMFIDRAYYRYLIRNSGNIMSSKNLKHIEDRLQIINNLGKFRFQYSQNLGDKCYINYYMFSMVRGLIAEKEEYGEKAKQLIQSNYSNFKHIAYHAIISALYFKLPKCLIKALIITLNPDYYFTH